MLTIFGFLAGIVMAFRFNVLILVPTMMWGVDVCARGRDGDRELRFLDSAERWFWLRSPCRLATWPALSSNGVCW